MMSLFLILVYLLAMHFSLMHVYLPVLLGILISQTRVIEKNDNIQKILILTAYCLFIPIAFIYLNNKWIYILITLPVYIISKLLEK